MGWLRKAGKLISDNVGSVIGGAASLAGGYMANESTRGSTREQMQFQERMSSTAHQREVQDLRLAGLNPILSANTGASSPSGASFTAEDVITPALSSAVAVQRTRNEVKRVKNETQLSNANVQAALANARNLQDQNNLIRQQTQQTTADTDKKMSEKIGQDLLNKQRQLENRVLELSLPALELDAAFYKSEGGGIMRSIDNVLGRGASAKLLQLLGPSEKTIIHRRK